MSLPPHPNVALHESGTAETVDSTATGPQPRFYQVTIVSDGRLRGAAHVGRRITQKARSRLKNGSGRAGEHPTPILALKNGSGRAGEHPTPILAVEKPSGLV